MDAFDPRDVKQTHHLQSVNLNWQILYLIAANDGMTEAELAQELDFSKSTIHNHLQALVWKQLVISLREENPVVTSNAPDYPIYKLSLAFLEFGRKAVSHYPIEIIRSQVTSIAKRTGELVAFAAPEYGSVVFVDVRGGSNAIPLELREGSRDSLVNTAFGKAMLSEYDRSEIKTAPTFDIGEEAPQSSVEEYFEELSTVQERGYAVDDATRSNVVSIAAPVTSEHRILGAIGVYGPRSRVDQDPDGEYASLVRSAAETIEIHTRE
jgi:DNA-binding IclR family transcriptional regulator